MKSPAHDEQIERLRAENAELRKEMEEARRTTNALNARLGYGEDSKVKEERLERLVQELRTSLREEQARVERMRKKAQEAERFSQNVRLTLEEAREAFQSAIEKVDELLEEDDE